jgi:hypothetical protein
MIGAAMERLDKLAAAAEEAWLFTLPLVETARTRTSRFASGGELNTFVHMRDLVDHTARLVTTPNNDTLYSSAQIDLSAGPVTLNIPASGERYLSLALMDAYTNNFAVLGTRTLGPDGGRFRLIGPDEPGGGEDVIRSPTRHVWALARILVDDETDLEAARAVQSGLTIQGPTLQAGPPPAARSADWRDYFKSADQLLQEDPPPATQLSVMRRIADLKLGAGGFDPDAFSPEEQDAIVKGVAHARELTRTARLGGGRAVDGWSYPDAGLGQFGENYRFRAQVALSGLAALPVVEAIYMRALGERGFLFAGSILWRLHFPPGGAPPVDGFWSLSLYEATPEGQFFFADNPLHRYALRNRTPGLRFNEDGSLDLWIGHDSPKAEREANWLPAPEGDFALFMRTYLPRPELLNGKYRLPRVERA